MNITLSGPRFDDSDSSSDPGQDTGTGTATLNKEKIKIPKRYKVLLHNDDYTTMEFVILVLQKVFHKNYEEAYAVMMNVHMKGVGVCGVYSYEIAETKQNEVKRISRENAHPLKCTLEAE